MYTPRINVALLGLYAVMTIALLIAALLFPAFCVFAYAPLRELILPPPVRQVQGII